MSRPPAAIAWLNTQNKPTGRPTPDVSSSPSSTSPSPDPLPASRAFSAASSDYFTGDDVPSSKYSVLREVRKTIFSSDARWGTRGGWQRWPSPMQLDRQKQTTEEFDFHQEFHEILTEQLLVSIIGRESYDAIWNSVVIPTDLAEAMEEEHGSDRMRWLSAEQRDAVMAILCGFNLALLGEPGTGKSAVINIAIATLRAAYKNASILVNSTTAVSANLIDGTTTHFAWALNTKKTEKYLKAFENTGLKHAIINITDEMSMLEPLLFYSMHERACNIKKPHAFRPIMAELLPFANMQMVFSGDFGQLPPVDRKLSSSERTNDNFALESARTRDDEYAQLQLTRMRILIDGSRYIFETPLFWSTFPFGVRLVKGMRQREHETRALISQLRTGTMTESTANMLHMLCQTNEDPRDRVRMMASNREVEKVNNERLQELGNPIVHSSLAMCHAITTDPERHRRMMNRKKRLFSAAVRDARINNVDVSETRAGQELTALLSNESTDQPWPCPLDLKIYGNMTMSPGSAVRLCQNIRYGRLRYANGMTGRLLGFLPIRYYISPNDSRMDKPSKRTTDDKKKKPDDSDDDASDVDSEKTPEDIIQSQAVPDCVRRMMRGTYIREIYGPHWRDLPKFVRIRLLDYGEFELRWSHGGEEVDVVFLNAYENTYGVHPLTSPRDWSRLAMWTKSMQDISARGANTQHEERDCSFLRYALPVVEFDNPRFGIAVIPPRMQTLCERNNPKVSCIQVPLRTNFASTVYGVQGSTHDKITVDLHRVSCAGELNVAVSRVRTLGGLKILGRLPIEQIYADPNALFYEQNCFRAAAQNN